MKVSKLCRAFSLTCGPIKMSSQWTILLTSHYLYACLIILFQSFAFFLIRISIDCTFRDWSCRYPLLYFFLQVIDMFPRIWKKRFVERGNSYPFWPFDVLQRCPTHRYQRVCLKADCSWLGDGFNSPATEGQSCVWRTTRTPLKYFTPLVFLRWLYIDVYGRNDTGSTTGGWEGRQTWSTYQSPGGKWPWLGPSNSERGWDHKYAYS